MNLPVRQERCYLCGFDPLDPKVSTCGLVDCPLKNAAPQGSSTDESRRTLERAQSGQPLGNDAIGKVKCGDSSVSRSVEHEPADAAPLTAEQIAFNEVGLDDDPWYRKAAYEHWRGERRR